MNVVDEMERKVWIDRVILFEYIELLLTSVGKTLSIILVYRPPPSITNGLAPTIIT